MYQLDNPEVLDLLSYDEMNLGELGIGKNGDKKTRTILFCVIPDNDKSFNFIVGMLYTLAFQELYYQADVLFEGRLPIPVDIWMDEFANVALPEDVTSIISTIRSREIYMNIMLQNMGQLKALFKDSWETIWGNCDTFVYLGGNENSSHKYVSEQLGKQTIDKQSDSQSRGKSGSSSKSHDRMGRETMMPDEVRMLKRNQCLILIAGEYPIRDRKYKTLGMKEFRKAKSLGSYRHKVDRMAAKNKLYGKNMEFLDSDSVEYYKKAQEKEDIRIYRFSAEEIILMDEESIRMVMAEHIYEQEEEFQEEVERQLAEENGSEVFNYMLQHDLSPDQKEQVKIGIDHGLSDEDIMCFLDFRNPAEMMAEMRETVEMDIELGLL